MKCPDCSKELIDVATACRCGWIKEGTRAPNAFSTESKAQKCNRTDCYLPALFSDGPCEHHYTQPFRERANAKSAELGLDTPAKQRAWFQAQAKRIHKPMVDLETPTLDPREIARQAAYGEVAVYQTREPGQDDEV